MKKELINPIYLTTKNVFKDMIADIEEISRGDLDIKENPLHTEKLSVSIGLTGQLEGFVYIGFDENTALQILSSMMGGMEFKEVNEMVKSGIGEIGNILMGNTSSKFNELGYSTNITPPTVIEGNVSISSDIARFLKIPLITNLGTINMYLSIKESNGGKD